MQLGLVLLLHLEEQVPHPQLHPLDDEHARRPGDAEGQCRKGADGQVAQRKLPPIHDRRPGRDDDGEKDAGWIGRGDQACGPRGEEPPVPQEQVRRQQDEKREQRKREDRVVVDLSRECSRRQQDGQVLEGELGSEEASPEQEKGAEVQDRRDRRSDQWWIDADGHKRSDESAVERHPGAVSAPFGRSDLGIPLGARARFEVVALRGDREVMPGVPALPGVLRVPGVKCGLRCDDPEHQSHRHEDE